MKKCKILPIIILLLLGNLSYSQTKSAESFSTKITKANIITYIKALEKNKKTFRENFIKQVEDNMEFDKMYMEQRGVGQKFIIIPMKKIYFSQHAKDLKNPPIQLILIVEDDKNLGKIYSADLVLFFPKNKTLTQMPKSAFRDFAFQNKTQIDGVYTYLNWGDVKQCELFIENGEREKIKIWKSTDNFKNSSNNNDCIEWNLVTDYYNKDGTVTTEKVPLGKTCTECPPGFKCDPIKK